MAAVDIQQAPQPRLLLWGGHHIALKLADFLQRHGYDVTHYRFREVEEVVHSAQDVLVMVLVDEGSEELAETLRRLRPHSVAPVLLVGTGEHREACIQALDMGADDFVCRDLDLEEGGELEPEFAQELEVRLRAALRQIQRYNQTHPDAARGRMELGDVTLSPLGHEVCVGTQPISLTSTERRLLERLMRDSPNLVYHEDLLRDLWGEHFVQERQYLRVYINRLRNKLTSRSQVVRILTEPGQGYRLVVQTQSEEQ
jgi:two-component system KDP operon response regulator KdpE